MVGGGGLRKLPKKCQVLFEWPLNSNINSLVISTVFELRSLFGTKLRNPEIKIPWMPKFQIKMLFFFFFSFNRKDICLLLKIARE